MSDKLDLLELKRSGVLPSPRGVLLSVMLMCQREQVSLQDLARAILADPVLAGRVIKLANGVNPNKTRPIAAVSPEVLILVGVQAVRQIALCLSLVEQTATGGCPGFDYGRFWSRSLAMGCAAQVLATQVRSAPPPEMFSCGLLAGIGKLVLASARPHAYSHLLPVLDGNIAADIHLAERALFGYSHVELASELMADWKLPRLFGDAVLHHETLDTLPAAPGSRQYCLAVLLNLSAAIADCLGGTREVDDLFSLAESVGLDADQMVCTVAVVGQAWSDWCTALGIGSSSHA